MYPDPDTCPAHIRNAIDRYVATGCEVGQFVTAVLENNLIVAVGAAADPSYVASAVSYCYWEIPSNAWGSPRAVNDWRCARKARVQL